jgi:vitamin B12 transporter
LGADALGGAIHLITELTLAQPMLSLAYAAGAFDTQQLAFSLRTRNQPSGLVAGASVFHDQWRNDYPIDVQVSDSVGRLGPPRARAPLP